MMCEKNLTRLSLQIVSMISALRHRAQLRLLEEFGVGAVVPLLVLAHVARATAARQRERGQPNQRK